MKNKISIIFIILSILIVSGCNKENPQKKEIKYKYTIWIGSSAFSSGYGTNEYVIDKNIVTFKNKFGKKIVTPLSSVNNIREN